MATAHDVGAAILRRHMDDPRFGAITTMKLQKLLYASQGIHLAETGSVIFDEPVQAWDGGPVVRSVWETLHGRRRLLPKDLELLGNESELSPSESRAVDEALDAYGSFSGDALSDVSHAEPPWREAYHGRGKNADLDPAAMAEYFQTTVLAGSDPDAATSALLEAIGLSVGSTDC